MDTLLPQALKPGDTIGLIAPSEPVEKTDIERAKAYIESCGYKLKLGKRLFYKIGDYTAGTAEDRADDLNWAFSDPEVKAIFVSEGGYAADQILDLINFDLIKKNPKIFVGYSDVTTLQLALFSKTGLISFSGPNGVNLHSQSDYSSSHFWPLLTGEKEVSVKPLKEKGWEVLRSGKGKGTLIGGNLDCICSLLGTEYDPFPKLADEKIILFWEEDGAIYNDIIRDMFQLKHARVFERCEGMLVGKITDSSEEGGYVGLPELKYVLLSLARAYDFPILWNVDFGHVDDKITIPQGIKAEVETKNQSIKFLDNL